MFLTFVSPPEDQDVDVRFSHSLYGKNESTGCLDAEVNGNVQYIRWHFLKGVVVRFRKPETHKRAAAP